MLPFDHVFGKPKPGRAFIANPSQHYIIPDVYIYKTREVKVALNANGIPRLASAVITRFCDSMEDDGSLTKDTFMKKSKPAVAAEKH
ncbi:MAG: hypothetical protein Ct9H90mP8_2450 [Pseudomonadota bacterium]|nr:MAG: hypothetical protein Ct9H90mP8_2450 [Pseudomonadota bacterium]